MEKEDTISVQWAQEDVEKSYRLLNSNNIDKFSSNTPNLYDTDDDTTQIMIHYSSFAVTIQNITGHDKVSYCT